MFKITIFDKYIFKQVFLATLVCLLLFIIVWIAPEILVKIIRKIFIYHVPFVQAMKLLLLEIPQVLGKALPVGILLGSIFTFDKLSKDSELSIFRGIGLSFNRIMAPVILLGVVFTGFCFNVGSSLIPAAEKIDQAKKDFSTHFVYIEKDKNGDLTQSVIVTSFKPNQVRGVYVVDFSKKKYDDAATFDSITYAPWALVYDDKWVLQDVLKCKIDANGIFEKSKKIGNVEILKGESAKNVYTMMKNSVKKDRVFTNSELKNYMNLLKAQEHTDEYKFMLCKYYQRFLHPLTCILFAILGCMLGFSPPRSQRLVGFTIAVGIVFAYYITLPFFDLLAQKGVLPAFVSAFAPIAAFIASIIIIKKYKDL